MEVVGLAGSITGLIQISGTVASLCYGYIGGVKRANDDIQQLMDEIISLTEVLGSLKKATDEFKPGAALGTQQQVQFNALNNLDKPLENLTLELAMLESKLRRRVDKKGFRKMASLLRWPFKDSENMAFVAKIERMKSLILLALNTDHVYLAKSINEGVQAVVGWKGGHEDEIKEKRRKVLRWLYPESCSATHDEIRGRRQAGTGEWLLGSLEFQALVTPQSPESRLLWGHGIPGAGKTFLSSVVIDHFKGLTNSPNSKCGVAYIYFDYKERENQKPIKVLASLVKQLLGNTLDLPDSLEELYDELEEGDQMPTIEALYLCFLSTLKLFDRIFLVFDALDECNRKERKELLLLFHKMKEDGVSLFVTSRQYPEDIQESFSSVPRIQILAQDSDIRSYVEKKIEESPRAKRQIALGNCRQSVVSEIIACAEGMFLLAKFHIEYICQQTTAREIATALKTLKTQPTEKKPLDPTYDRIMGSILQQPSSRVNLAIRVLSWLVKAQRTLAIDEIQTAVSIKPDEYELDPLDLPDRTVLLDVCGGLVTIEENSDTVRLAHFTVQEYLVRRAKIPEDTNIKLAINCLTYLSFDMFSGGLQHDDYRIYMRLECNPFLKYAARYTIYHLNDCTETLTKDLVSKFLKRPENFCLWFLANKSIQEYCIPEYLLKRYTGPQIPLLMASAIGNSLVVQELLEDGADVSARHLSDGSTAIEWAVMNGNEAISRLLIKSGADPLGSNTNRGMLLGMVAREGYHSLITLLIECGVSINDNCDDQGRRALHFAALYGKETVARVLLENGADIEAQCNFGTTALHGTAYGGVAVARLLLEQGANIDAQNGNGRTLLCLAAWRGHEEMVELLLRNGAGVEVQDSLQCTPLLVAVDGGYEAVTRLLLGKGADVEARDVWGSNALLLAVYRNDPVMVQLLLERNANVEARGEDGYNPLLAAAVRGREEIVRLLLEKGADVEVENNGGSKPLHIAAYYGHTAVIKQLLDKGANSEARDGQYNTPMHIAANNGHAAVIELLIEKGSNIEVRDGYDSTSTNIKESNGYVASIKQLLNKGVLVDTRDGHYSTPLHIAASNGHVALTQMLLEKGAAIEARDGYGNTPLHLGTFDGHTEIVGLLLEKRADIEARDVYGRTPLHIAAWNGYTTVAKLLLQKGSHVDTNDGNDNTPLHLGVSGNNLAVVELLIEMGSNIKARNQSYYSPLYISILKGSKPVAKMLLERGADPQETDHNGVNPLAIAISKGYEELVALLIDFGVNTEILGDPLSKYSDYTPLNFAVQGGHTEIVKLLLDKSTANTDPNNINTALLRAIRLSSKKNISAEVQSIKSKIPLLTEKYEKYEAITRLLVDKGADIEYTRVEGVNPLELASSRGNEAVVKFLLEKGANIEVGASSRGWKPLFFAIAGHHEAVVEVLLNNGANPNSVAAKGRYRTPLHTAVADGLEAIVKLLLEKGADTEVLGTSRDTPLILATSLGHNAVVKVLLDYGANIEAQLLKYNRTALFVAIESGYGKVELVKTLLDRGANTRAKMTPSRFTPIMLAAYFGYDAVVNLFLNNKGGIKESGPALMVAMRAGHKSVVELLLKSGADIETRDGRDNTALHIAATLGPGNEAIVKLLLENNVSIEAQNQDGDTALHYGVRFGDFGLVKVLIEKGINIDARNHQGDTPLFSLALLTDHHTWSVSMVKLLLAAGAHLEAVNSFGRTPLHAAVSLHNEDIARVFLEAGARVNTRDRNGDTVLHASGSKQPKSESMINLLLEWGADIEARQGVGIGDTALLAAVERDDEETVKLLLDRGADIEARTNTGDTALLCASFPRPKMSIAKLLLERGADIEARDYIGNTPLLLGVNPNSDDMNDSCRNGTEDTSFIELLLENGADIEAQGYSGRTPLLTAVYYGRWSMVKVLLSKGADITARDKNGRTPLHIAVRPNSVCGIKLIRLLIQKGADINAQDLDGNTPLLLATSWRSANDEAIIKLLLKAGASTAQKNWRGATFIQNIVSPEYLAVAQILEGAFLRELQSVRDNRST